MFCWSMDTGSGRNIFTPNAKDSFHCPSGLVFFESVMHGRIFLKCTSITFPITQLRASITIAIT